jgi:glycosyltransferase involved in cell wall biosynthesis
LLVAKLVDVPVAGTYHTDIPQYVGKLTADQFCEDTAWSYVIWFYNQLDEVMVPSRSTRDQLLRRGLSPEKTRPLPRWVDTQRFSPEHADPGVVERMGAMAGVRLLYAGRVSKEKNLGLLADAFAELESRGVPVTLIVAGDGPYRADMERRLAGHSAIFTGFLPQDELARVYASTDLLVFPSTTDTFGNVVLEAQASGLPVIVSDQGGPHELILPGKTGLVVPGNDKAALVAAMARLVDSPEGRAGMAQEARAFALRGRLDAAVQFSTLLGGLDVDWSWILDRSTVDSLESAAA